MGWLKDILQTWSENRTERIEIRQENKTARVEAKQDTKQTIAVDTNSAYEYIANVTGVDTSAGVTAYGTRNSATNILSGTADVLTAGADLAGAITGTSSINSLFGNESVDLSSYGINAEIPMSYLLMGGVFLLILILRRS